MIKVFVRCEDYLPLFHCFLLPAADENENIWYRERVLMIVIGATTHYILFYTTTTAKTVTHIEKI
jgi:hypothetical protein